MLNSLFAMTSDVPQEPDPSVKRSPLREAISNTREFFDHVITTGRVSCASERFHCASIDIMNQALAKLLTAQSFLGWFHL